MAIEIYDKASIVKKDNLYYYFLKNGSKNSFTCPLQSIVDNNFNNKFIKRQKRDSYWHLIAVGDKNSVNEDKIADTEWNAPTSYYYGQVRFGNKKNIALYFAKSKNKILDYDLLSDIQKDNIDKILKYYIDELKRKYTIDLLNIKDNNKMLPLHTYCSNEAILLDNNYIVYNGKKYWDLDNL